MVVAHSDCLPSRTWLAGRLVRVSDLSIVQPWLRSLPKARVSRCQKFPKPQCRTHSACVFHCVSGPLSRNSSRRLLVLVGFNQRATPKPELARFIHLPSHSLFSFRSLYRILGCILVAVFTTVRHRFYLKSKVNERLYYCNPSVATTAVSQRSTLTSNNSRARDSWQLNHPKNLNPKCLSKSFGPIIASLTNRDEQQGHNG